MEPWQILEDKVNQIEAFQSRLDISYCHYYHHIYDHNA